MGLTSQDLPPEMKENLLRQIREKLGYAEYNRLVEAVGKDGLIDFVLAQTFQNATTTSQPRTKMTPAKARSYKTVFYLAVFLAAAVGAYYPDGKVVGGLYNQIFPVILVIITVICVLAALFAWLTGTDLQSWMADWTSWYVVAAVVTIALAAAVSVFVNISINGAKVVQVIAGVFVYCFLLGAILWRPSFGWVEAVQDDTWRSVFQISGIVIVMAAVWFGWFKLIYPWFRR